MGWVGWSRGTFGQNMCEAQRCEMGQGPIYLIIWETNNYMQEEQRVPGEEQRKRTVGVGKGPNHRSP